MEQAQNVKAPKKNCRYNDGQEDIAMGVQSWG